MCGSRLVSGDANGDLEPSKIPSVFERSLNDPEFRKFASRNYNKNIVSF